MSRRYIPAGSTARGNDPVAISADEAGWRYSGIGVIALAADETRTIATGDSEVFVLPLSATDVTVTIDGDVFQLTGRTSVFARVSDFLYVGRDTELTVTSASGGEIAVPSARCERRLPARYGPAEEIAIEIRGAGPASRQVTNFASPEAWPHADRLMCVELLTPDGNWSSYPPHKHDDSPDCPVNNEEIYYFRIGVAGSTEYAPKGFGLHRTYTSDGRVDDNLTVGDGDVYLIHAAITVRAWRPPATRCTTSTCSPARAGNVRWRSATTRPTTGYASRGKRWPPTRAARSPMPRASSRQPNPSHRRSDPHVAPSVHRPSRRRTDLVGHL